MYYRVILAQILAIPLKSKNIWKEEESCVMRWCQFSAMSYQLKNWREESARFNSLQCPLAVNSFH
jgi:hypothetical protein